MHEAAQRLERLNKAILEQLLHWRWRPVVEALQALRGVQVLHAVRIVAELGDFHRFETPRKLMAYLGLIPTETFPARGAAKGRSPRQVTLPRAAPWSKLRKRMLIRRAYPG